MLIYATLMKYAWSILKYSRCYADLTKQKYDYSKSLDISPYITSTDQLNSRWDHIRLRPLLLLSLEFQTVNEEEIIMNLVMQLKAHPNAPTATLESLHLTAMEIKTYGIVYAKKDSSIGFKYTGRDNVLYNLYDDDIYFSFRRKINFKYNFPCNKNVINAFIYYAIWGKK